MNAVKLIVGLIVSVVSGIALNLYVLPAGFGILGAFVIIIGCVVSMVWAKQKNFLYYCVGCQKYWTEEQRGEGYFFNEAKLRPYCPKCGNLDLHKTWK